jgi:hypothetical protein
MLQYYEVDKNRINWISSKQNFSLRHLKGTSWERIVKNIKKQLLNVFFGFMWLRIEFSKCCYEPSDSTKGPQFIDTLSDYELVKSDNATWSSRITLPQAILTFREIFSNCDPLSLYSIVYIF